MTTKADIATTLAAQHEISAVQAGKIIDSFLTAINDSLKNGKRVDLRNFGTFKVEHRADRIGRNPKNGETITIPAHNKPVFKPATALKEAVN